MGTKAGELVGREAVQQVGEQVAAGDVAWPVRHVGRACGVGGEPCVAKEIVEESGPA